jgi:hypothetical protein
LPARARIHDVFHVGLLKPFHGDPPVHTPALPPLNHGRVVVQPEKVLNSRIARGKLEVLVHWMGAPAAETVWVASEEFRETSCFFGRGEMSCGTRPLGGAARSTGCLSSAGKQEARLRDRSLSLLGFVA